MMKNARSFFLSKISLKTSLQSLKKNIAGMGKILQTLKPDRKFLWVKIQLLMKRKSKQNFPYDENSSYL